MKSKWFGLALLAALSLIVAACGGGAATTTTIAATTTTAAPTTTTTAARTTGDVTLDAPAEVEAGSEFEVSWTGPNNTGDYITVVPVGADEGAFESYFNTASGPSGTLLAPIEDGEYEIRYVDGTDAATVGSSTITVTPYKVTLEAPAEVEAGTEFEASWTGPDGPGDYVTIVVADADEGVYNSYFNTATGPTGTLIAPIDDGDHEIRYVNGQTSVTMASKAIVVTPYQITIEAPAEVQRGAEFEVAWTGPNGPSDYITIVLVNADEGAYNSYFDTSTGPNGTLVAPAEPGNYEIRYVHGMSSRTLARAPIVVE